MCCHKFGWQGCGAVSHGEAISISDYTSDAKQRQRHDERNLHVSAGRESRRPLLYITLSYTTTTMDVGVPALAALRLVLALLPAPELKEYVHQLATPLTAYTRCRHSQHHIRVASC